MTGRLIRTSVLTVLVIPLLLAVAPAGPDFAHSQASARPELLEKIVFSSSRDTPGFNSRFQVKIFLMNPDGTNPEKLTSPADCLPTFAACGDAFAALSPDGKWIVFDSNRNKAATEPQNTSDLFLMKSDGTGQTFLTRGSSATWSPSGGKIAFHRSASGTGLPPNPNANAGAPAIDSDIFVMDIDAGVGPRNVTNTPGLIENDANWVESPDGQKIVYTAQDPDDLAIAEIYVLTVNPGGTPVQDPVQLTFRRDDERAPAWSPDGTQIAFMCKNGGLDLEICVMNADGTGVRQLTNNDVLEGAPSWSLDGQQIVFSRARPLLADIFKINADGTGETQLTATQGWDGFADWGVVRVVDGAAKQTPTSTPTATPTPTATNTPIDTPAPPIETPTEQPADTTAPTVSVPGDIVVEADPGADQAVVTFDVSAEDDVDGTLAPSCDADSGDAFPIDTTTTVTCTATDTAGNKGSGTFKVTVNPPPDTTPPVFANVPGDFSVDAVDDSGAPVTYDQPTATDDVDGDVHVDCAPASGSQFPVGSTTVTCTAVDAASNAAQATFTVTVNPPVPTDTPTP